MHAFLKRKTGFDIEKGPVHQHLSSASEIRKILNANNEIECINSYFYPFLMPFIHVSLFINEVYRK